jgi:hypothetical protein
MKNKKLIHKMNIAIIMRAKFSSTDKKRVKNACSKIRIIMISFLPQLMKIRFWIRLIKAYHSLSIKADKLTRKNFKSK